MKEILNKWQAILRFGKDWRRGSPTGWYILRFGVFNITSFPKEGVELRKPNYKGFLLHFYIWLPIEKN